MPVTWLPALLECGHTEWFGMMAALHALLCFQANHKQDRELLPLMTALCLQYLARRQALMGEESMVMAAFSPVLQLYQVFVHGPGQCEMGVDDCGRAWVRGVPKGNPGRRFTDVVDAASEVRGQFDKVLFATLVSQYN
jgi:hypothetical protein